MSFEFTTDVSIRYDDLDTYGHVNNVRYGTYFEEARIDYLAEVVGQGDREYLAATGEGTGIVIANLEIDFERPIRSADSVTVGVRVPNLGTKSFPFEYEVRDDGAVVATGESTQVTYDRDAEAPRPIPEDWQEAIAEFEWQ
ncbi:acyl-CoA thioesterase [Halomicroarcula sp. F13]|uniref:Acyl-CoA thioesterase n=1 Tax=Haloarcula rubra TaxID=2487747 RepID=A0AAW4PNS9_9EURY|nr:thioesterase family protein [Halomicroarcula rubra]MBX0322093.1 acyl-CoA thioesterase [Halomicroarcula rubra]